MGEGIAVAIWGRGRPRPRSAVPKAGEDARAPKCLAKLRDLLAPLVPTSDNRVQGVQ
jgi:hypothetical protein